MISNKRVLKTIAKNYKMDSDELLISLWDSFGKKFDYLKNENDIVKNKDYKDVKKLVDSKLKDTKLVKKDRNKEKPLVVIYEEHDFSSVGRVVPSMTYINKDEIMKIYEELVVDFANFEDPIEPSGVKDHSLLDSAIFHAQTSFGNKIKYPTAESSAGALMYAITHNHAFHNGNKRTAMVAMLVFLDRHHISLTCSEDDLFKKSLELADHKLVEPEHLYPDAEIYKLAAWINDNSKIFKRGERPITLKKLRQILDYFNCIILDNGRVQRTIESMSFLGYKKTRLLVSKKTIGNTISEGNEINMGLIKSLREDLELNPNNGIDSETFYERADFTISDFINNYKNLLKRLSKV